MPALQRKAGQEPKLTASRQDSVHTDWGHSPTVPICKKQTRSGDDDHGQPQSSWSGRSTVTREVPRQARKSSQQVKVRKVNSQAQTFLQRHWGKNQRQVMCLSLNAASEQKGESLQWSFPPLFLTELFQKPDPRLNGYTVTELSQTAKRFGLGDELMLMTLALFSDCYITLNE